MAKKAKAQDAIKQLPDGSLDMLDVGLQKHLDEAKRLRIRALLAKSNVDRIAYEQRAKEQEKLARDFKDKILTTFTGIEYADLNF